MVRIRKDNVCETLADSKLQMSVTIWMLQMPPPHGVDAF
jgi:hypothetical protein